MRELTYGPKRVAAVCACARRSHLSSVVEGWPLGLDTLLAEVRRLCTTAGCCCCSHAMTDDGDGLTIRCLSRGTGAAIMAWHGGQVCRQHAPAGCGLVR